MRNFAMLGMWHVHAEGYAKQLSALPDCRIAKVWDADPAAAEKWAAELGAVPASVEDILSDASIEGVLLCSATNEHADLLLRACRAGKAVFTEKVLTLNDDDAEAVRRAVVENHTRFAISFPHFSEPATQATLALARSGKLGKLNFARVRKAHDGSTGDWLPPHFYDPVACGGGAMIDLGAHPMYLLCAILGEPIRVQSSFVNFTDRPVTDNDVSLLTFDGGAIGVSETSFVSRSYPFIIEIGGEDGTVLQRDGEVRWCGKATDGQWVTPELPAAQPSSLQQWALATAPEDISPDFNIDAAVRLTKVMTMAYSGR